MVPYITKQTWREKIGKVDSKARRNNRGIPLYAKDTPGC
jgi:hypothetical protein